MKKLTCLLMTSTLIITATISGCANNGLESVSTKRQSIISMRNIALEDLYKAKPKTRKYISDAPGYGVFSNANVNVIFASFSGGYGVVTNNKVKGNTYMKMAEAGIGFGLGLKDYRTIFVFHDKETMKNFVDNGWVFGVHADAAAKAGKNGGALGSELVLDGITVYQLTESGLALQATVKGTKYWKADDLN